MHKEQRVSDMVDEVLARQAKARVERTGESFEDALEAVMESEVGSKLEELRAGPHGEERAEKWQEGLLRRRAGEREGALGWTPADTPPSHRGQDRGIAGQARETHEKSVPVPEAWIGQSVNLTFTAGSSTEYIGGNLEEVNDRGIVLSAVTHIGHPAQYLFYPWGAVIQLVLSGKDR